MSAPDIRQELREMGRAASDIKRITDDWGSAAVGIGIPASEDAPPEDGTALERGD